MERIRVTYSSSEPFGAFVPLIVSMKSAGTVSSSN